MAKGRPSLLKASLGAARASKRMYFDPASITRKPKYDWISLEVGQSLTINDLNVKASSIRSRVWCWSNESGRVFTVHDGEKGVVVTRTE